MPLSMRVETLVNALVRQELQGKGREKEALHFHFDCSIANYTDGETYSERRGLHLLYHQRPGFATISVFTAVTDSPFAKVSEVKEWKHETSHDSCWAQIQTFSQVYFEMCAKINAAMKADGLQEIAPKDMSEHNGFSLFGPVFDWVGVEVSKDEEDDRNYRRKVKLL